MIFQILDLTINLTNKYWAQELVPIRYGGAESVAFFRQNIALAEGRLAGGNTNEIPLVQISDQKVTRSNLCNQTYFTWMVDLRR